MIKSKRDVLCLAFIPVMVGILTVSGGIGTDELYEGVVFGANIRYQMFYFMLFFGRVLYTFGDFEEYFGAYGMYRVIRRNRFIFLNKELSDKMLRIVCAHELGHDQLHRRLAQANCLHEFMLYDMTTRPEYEANIVAAEILIDTDELLEYIYSYNYSAEQIAMAIDTEINLVALKIAHLTGLGYELRPIDHRSDFLR